MRDTEKPFVLFQDDFSGFAIGPLPFDREHSATGEYHYVVNPGYQGAWYDPITNCWFRGPNWVVTRQDGMHVMEQMRVRNPLTHNVCSTLVAGDKDWSDYTAEVDLRALCTTDQVGLLVRYQASLQHYAVFVVNQELQLVRVIKKIQKLEKLGLSPKRSQGKIKTTGRTMGPESIIPPSLSDLDVTDDSEG